MRKITSQAFDAWVAKKQFKRKNTEITVDPYGNRRLYLFGNCIAKEENDNFYINHCGWVSSTTRERLNMFPNVHVRIFQGGFVLIGRGYIDEGWINIPSEI